VSIYYYYLTDLCKKEKGCLLFEHRVHVQQPFKMSINLKLNCSFIWYEFCDFILSSIRQLLTIALKLITHAKSESRKQSVFLTSESARITCKRGSLFTGRQHSSMLCGCPVLAIAKLFLSSWSISLSHPDTIKTMQATITKSLLLLPQRL